MKWADSHAHLNNPDFSSDLDDVASSLKEAGYLVLNVAYDIESARKGIEIAERFDNMLAAVGIHPNDTASVGKRDFAELRELASHEKVAAIGETGLDYFRNRSPREAQKEALLAHLAISREAKKPVIIHCREAFHDILPVLEKEFDPTIGGVLHCFSEGPGEAAKGVELGFYISFAGNLTYPKASRLREAMKAVPPERLLVETDCPYLAPQSMRGKRNEPSFLVETAKVMAAERGVTLEDISRITYANYRNLFMGMEHTTGEIVYRIRNSLYVNVTGRCTNLCDFCPRVESPTVQGHYLGLERDPEAGEILEAIAGQTADEVVFCGFGEPTIRLDVVKKVAREVKRRGMKTRLNTNGQGSLINGRNIVPELEGLMDVVSVSINALDRETYNRICSPEDPEKAYDSIIDFIRAARGRFPEVVASAVDVPEGVDIGELRRFVEEDLKVRFRLRAYNVVG